MTDQAFVSQTYRVCADPKNDIWRKYSFWGMAEDVVLNDGTDLQTKIDSLKAELDTDVTETNTIPIKGKNKHDELEEKFKELKLRYGNRMDEADDIINNNILTETDEGTTLNGWPLLIDLLNSLHAETKDLTDDMLNDLSSFDPGDYNLDTILSQADYDILLERLREIGEDEQEKMNLVKSALGDVTSLSYMLTDGTNTTDTKVAPLIVHHQNAIDNLKASSQALSWQTVQANVAITPSSNVSSVSGTLRYQKDTGLCMANWRFTGVSCPAGSEVTLGTLGGQYAPLITGSNDPNIWNTMFIVQVQDISANPEVIGIIDDSGVITLKNRGQLNFADVINVGFAYIGNTSA